MDEQGTGRKFSLKIIGGSAVVLGMLVVAGLFYKHSREQAADRQPLQTRFPIPEHTTVPRPQTADLPDHIARPAIVLPANRTATADLRTFAIRAANNEFSPDTIIVHANDVAEITVTAEDHDYDFTQPDYGIHELVPKGTSKMIALNPSDVGKFVFYCSTCSGRPQGSIIIVPRSVP